MTEPYGLPAGTSINYRALGFPAWVDQLCLQWGLDSSTYPGHQEGDRPDIGSAPNPDRLNRGIDWAGDPQKMLDFARWLVSIGPERQPGVYGPAGLEMVIYRHPPTGEDVVYPSWVDYSGDLPQHTDHVHTRFSASVIDVAPRQQMTVPIVQETDGTWTSTNPAWAHLIQRESSGDPTIIQQITDINSGGNEAEGLFQITPATWRAHRGDEFAPNARLATPQQQAIVAARIFTANPSGSDWGAGLPGREDPSELAAGLVPLTEIVPPPPPPPGEVWMPDVATDQLVREIHRALFEKLPSKSRYGDPAVLWTALELIRNDDGFWFDDVTERNALRGDQWSQVAIEKAAARGDPLAKRFYNEHASGRHHSPQPQPTATAAPPPPPSLSPQPSDVASINTTIMALAAQMQQLKQLIAAAIG